MLTLGSHGTDVSRLQQHLKRAGFNPGAVDGQFGAKTKAAVLRYQRAKHLHVDGVVGPGTSRGLFGSTAKKFWDGKSDFTSKPTHGGAVSGHAPGATHTMSRLAHNARSVAMSMGGYRSQALCATGVSRAIARTMGVHVSGNGNQIDNNLPRSKFKELHISLAEALRTPGLVLTWERTSTRMGRIYGHTAITLGDGHSSASDFVERNTLGGSAGRRGLRIFQPRA